MVSVAGSGIRVNAEDEAVSEYIASMQAKLQLAEEREFHHLAHQQGIQVR